MQNINQIKKEILHEVKPSKEEITKIKLNLNSFLERVKKNIKKQKIKAEVFIGGSFAKNTMIKSKEYDIDVFIRFDGKYKEKMSNLTEKILAGFKKQRIHGSRDYFKIKIDKGFFIEIVPVKKIKNPKEAENVTDFSYSHVNYIKNKLKSDKILDGIRLAKIFCHANNSYGAESYIKGFSGYSLELLIYYFKGFDNFVGAIAKSKSGEKVIIDIEKHFKNKQEVLINVNSSKLQSPIILIDPTYKQRNALAALSNETFNNFREICKKFLKNPGREFFVKKEIDFLNIKSEKNSEMIKMEIKTEKQEGDIAGSKLMKFYRHLESEIAKYFSIAKKGFQYNNDKSSKVFFIVKRKKELIFNGPKVGDADNIKLFKKKHKKTFVKSGRIYSSQKINFDIKDFFREWERNNRKKMREMSITEMRIFG